METDFLVSDWISLVLYRKLRSKLRYVDCPDLMKHKKLTMVINHPFNIPHNLPIPPMSLLGHHLHAMTSRFKDACWLGVQDKRDGEEAFDPFCLLSVPIANKTKELEIGARDL